MKYVLALMLGLSVSSWALAEDDNEAEHKRSVYHNISPAFVSNFGLSEKKLSYVKAEVALKVESEALLEKVKSNEPLVRHQIVMLLSSQTKEQMSDPAAQENIRLTALSRVKEALAEEIGKTGVQDLLFTSFVVQI
jgi:flagellar FliL protein